MSADDTVDNREAHAGAVSRLLGGEERFEDAPLGFFVHAVSGVADLDPRIAPRHQAGPPAAKRFRQIHP